MSTVFSYKNLLWSLDLFIITLFRSLLQKYSWFVLTYFYFAGTCLFKIFVNKFRNWYALNALTSSISKFPLKWVAVESFIDSVWYNLWFLNALVFWKVQSELVRIKSLQNGFSRFLKYVFCLTIFFKLRMFKKFEIVSSVFWSNTVINDQNKTNLFFELSTVSLATS